MSANQLPLAPLPTLGRSDNPPQASEAEKHGYWEYSQSKGTMTHVLRNGERKLIGVGYSGYGSALDDPADQDEGNEGPIPRGSWIIGHRQNHALADGHHI